jgi:DNA-binding transcriptional MerR regulator
LVFVNEDAREDFADLAVEMKLIPDIKELCEGESKEDKNKRKMKELGIKPINKMSKKKSKLIELTFEQKVNNKIQGMEKQIDKLRKQLENESNEYIRIELNRKIHHLTSLIANKNFTV